MNETSEAARLRGWLELIAEPILTGRERDGVFIPSYDIAYEWTKQATKKALAGHPVPATDDEWDDFWAPIE